MNKKYIVSAVIVVIGVIVVLLDVFKFNYFIQIENGETAFMKEKVVLHESRDKDEVVLYEGWDKDEFVLHESWDKDRNGLNDCEKEGICDHTVDYSKPRIIKKKNDSVVDGDFYSKLEVVATEEIIIEIDKKKRDCVGVVPRKCLGVKWSKDGEWESFYEKIDGFNYVEGTQYTLKIRTKRYKYSDSIHIPADAPLRTNELIEIISETK